MNKIRIAYLVNAFSPSGLETYVLNLINHLDRDLFTPYLYIAYFPYEPYLKFLRRDIVVRQFNRHKISDRVFYRNFYGMLKKDRIRLLHTNNWGTLVEGVFAKTFIPYLKLVYVQHGLEYNRFRNAPIFKNLLRKIFGRISMKMIDEVVSVSHIGKIFLKNEWGAAKVHVIYNGIDINRFLPESSLKRRHFKLKENDFVLCSVGRIARVKNYLSLLKAFRILLSKLPEAKLLHIGRITEFIPDEKEQIISFIKENDLLERVQFIGVREDVHQILPLCDVFVLSSLSEGLSLSLLEAQSAGLPAVVTRVGGNPEIIKNGYNGFLVPVNDETLFAEAVYRLARDAELRFQMGVNARENVIRKFNLDQCVTRYERIYRF